MKTLLLTTPIILEQNKYNKQGCVDKVTNEVQHFIPRLKIELILKLSEKSALG